MIFGSEQLTSSEVRESTKTMGSVAVSLTQEGHITSILQSSQAKCYSIGDAQRLKSETGDGVRVTWDQHHQKG